MLFNPGIFTILSRRPPSNTSAAALSIPMDDLRFERWQALCRDGQVVEAIKEVRTFGLDLPQAYALVNEFRVQEGLLPPSVKRWWWPF